MLIQPVILTTPQRSADHVASIRAHFVGRERFAEPMVYCDERQDGAAVSTRNAISMAAATGGHVLFLEDDLLVDVEAPAAVARAEFPEDVAAIAFCDMREVPEYAPCGLYTCSALGSDGRGWWGNQAMLIHRDIVVMSTREDWFSPRIEASRGIRAHAAAYGDGGRNCSDIRLSLLIHHHGGARSSYAVHVPSLFKHVGHESACFPGRGMGERETRNWIADRRRYGVDP
jgi:hypothetical protein